MSAVSALRAAHPRHTTKVIASELGCSPRQARRMLSTGRIPQTLRTRALQLVETAIARNNGELARLRAELRAERHEAMLARAADRRKGAVGPDTGDDQGQIERAGLPFVTPRGEETPR